MNVLSPSPKQKFFDNNGKPAAGYQLFTYEAGTSTKLDTYPDESTASPNANPIILDFRGECNLWIPPNVAYKYVLAPPGDTDPPTAPIWTTDDVLSDQLITLYGGVDSGAANTYILNFTANFSAYTDGTLIYWVPSATNTGASTLNVNGLGPVAIVDPNGTAVVAGQIIANQISAVMYLNGAFVLLSVSVATGSFTATITGMSASTTGTVFYRIAGGMCTLYATSNIIGTSNATTMTMTGLPLVVRPTVARSVICGDLVNNGVSIIGAGAVNGPAITFSSIGSSGSFVVYGSFTNSGDKGIATGWNVFYPL